MTRIPSKATVQAWVVRKVDNTIRRINHYPAYSVVCFLNTCPLDSDLSGGHRYPPFEHPGPDDLEFNYISGPYMIEAVEVEEANSNEVALPTDDNLDPDTFIPYEDEPMASEEWISEYEKKQKTQAYGAPYWTILQTLLICA